MKGVNPSNVRDRGYSGESSLSLAEIKDRERTMAVAMAQPHRMGVSAAHGDAWQASALGRFVRTQWSDKSRQREMWGAGERYAQLIDEERIRRGLTPRQCAEAQTAVSGLTLQEQFDRRREAEQALSDAEGAIREVDNQSVGAVRTLAWEDREIPDRLHGRAANALYKLSVYFERLDKPKVIR